jgi:hypothetical protein
MQTIDLFLFLLPFSLNVIFFVRRKFRSGRMRRHERKKCAGGSSARVSNKGKHSDAGIAPVSTRRTTASGPERSLISAKDWFAMQAQADDRRWAAAPPANKDRCTPCAAHPTLYPIIPPHFIFHHIPYPYYKSSTLISLTTILILSNHFTFYFSFTNIPLSHDQVLF